MNNKTKRAWKIPCISLLLLFICFAAYAQKGTVITGNVVDKNDEPLTGVNITLKGNTSVGTVTDFDGNFSLTVPAGTKTIVATYVGMTTQDINIQDKQNVRVVMSENEEILSEVVVVGYGQQKKASVVGAITQTTGKVLERAAGISDDGVLTHSAAHINGETMASRGQQA